MISLFLQAIRPEQRAESLDIEQKDYFLRRAVEWEKCQHVCLKIPNWSRLNLPYLWTYGLGLCIVAACTYGEYHGILINSAAGYAGTQLYDPFNAPHAIGNLSLRLQNVSQGVCGAALASSPLAYFASPFTGTHELFPLALCVGW
jgi:hypothetical protein